MKIIPIFYQISKKKILFGVPQNFRQFGCAMSGRSRRKFLTGGKGVLWLILIPPVFRQLPHVSQCGHRMLRKRAPMD